MACAAPDLETEAWKLTDDVLTPTQAEEFRGVLAQRRLQNPRVNSVAFIHFVDFAKAIGRPASGDTTAASAKGLIQSIERLMAALAWRKMTRARPALATD